MLGSGGVGGCNDHQDLKIGSPQKSENQTQTFKKGQSFKVDKAK
jgi:hypothetical protein